MKKLNNVEISDEDLEKIRESLAKSTQEKLVEVAPNEFKILMKLQE